MWNTVMARALGEVFGVARMTRGMRGFASTVLNKLAVPLLSG